MEKLLHNRELPNADDAEQALLGAILKHNDCLAEVVTLTKPSDFYVPAHRRIFTRMLQLWEMGTSIEEVTLVHAMTEPREIEEVGGVAYLTSLTDNVVKRTSATQYAAIVREKAQLREFIHACDLGVNIGLANDQPAAVCVSRIHDALLAIEANTQKQPALHVAQVTDEVFADLERLRCQPGERVGLTTGIDSLDLATTGIRPGEFWLLGGRTGEGKSSFALKTILDNARCEIPVLLITPEMRRDQIVTRIWAQYGQIRFDKLRDPKRLTEAEYGHLQRTMLEVARLPIYIDDASSLSIREIVARARMMVKRHRIGLIAVDYIQLVGAEGRDERQRISAISNGLRELAKEGVPVLALSQLTRPREGNLNRRPTKFDLKESGALEADAHTVLLIFRRVDEATLLPTGSGEIIIAKQRNGPLSIEPVCFDERYLIFQERR
jgi:replicative DNA helicase